MTESPLTSCPPDRNRRRFTHLSSGLAPDRRLRLVPSLTNAPSSISAFAAFVGLVGPLGYLGIRRLVSVKCRRARSRPCSSFALTYEQHVFSNCEHNAPTNGDTRLLGVWLADTAVRELAQLFGKAGFRVRMSSMMLAPSMLRGATPMIGRGCMSSPACEVRVATSVRK